MSAPRWIGLPVLAAFLVAATVTVQLREGGGQYEPLKPPSACHEHAITPQASGIEGLTEQLVLIGLSKAACSLTLSREEFVLELAQSGEVSGRQAEAIQQGLLDAVEQMSTDGSLPHASDLLDEAMTNADLHPIAKRAIRLLPDKAVNGAVKVDDVLSRAISSLDIQTLLRNLTDQDEINRQVEVAVTQAVKDSLIARAKELIPDIPGI